MSDSDKPDTQELILKQLKSIKIALCLVVVIMLLLSGVIVVGGVVVGIASLRGGDHYADEDGYETGMKTSDGYTDHSTGEAVRIQYNEVHVDPTSVTTSSPETVTNKAIQINQPISRVE